MPSGEQPEEAQQHVALAEDDASEDARPIAGCVSDIDRLRRKEWSP